MLKVRLVSFLLYLCTIKQTKKINKMATTTKYNHLFTEENILRTCIKLNMRDLANAEVGSKEFHALAKLVANGRKKLKELTK